MVKVTIKPRLEVSKWSLYWKTSMCTKTFMLDTLTLDDVTYDGTTAKEIKAAVAAKIGLPAVETLHRLEEFVEPWELIMYKGREMDDDKTMADCGLPNVDGTEIIVVRKQLVAEGWKIKYDDNEDSDTEEEDF